MMPSLDHCVNNQPEMTTLTNTLEVFDTYKPHRDDKDSDEESFHLPLDDDEIDTKFSEPIKNGLGNETEEDILNKFDSVSANVDNIDSQLEERLLNDDEEEKKIEEKQKKEEEGEEKVDETGEEEKKDEVVEEQKEEEEKMVVEDSSGEKLVNGDVSDHEKPDNLEIVSSKEKEEAATAISEEPPTEKVEEPEKNVPETDNKAAIENLSTMDDNASMEDARAIEESESNSDQIKSVDTNNIDKKTAEKCENSNQNDDSEDLFDISIIRDVEEDNAESAYNEANHDNEDSDKMDEDSGNEKTNHIEDEEDEEMDVDKQDDHLKNDDVDIEEDNLKMESDGVKGDENGESENDTNKTDDLVQINDDNVQTVSENVDSENAVTECRLDEITGTLVGAEGSESSAEKSSESTEKEEEGDKVIIERRKSLKRTASEGSDEETAVSKKSRTDNEKEVEEEEDEEVQTSPSPAPPPPAPEPPKEKPPLRTLLSLADFMRTKKNNRRLNMQDLEEFCVQKICEAIVHKSDLGDVHHQLKLQEQLIESMRKEIQQLTKQARDLEIVNKKLMNDLKQQNTTQKPLNPLKITRSVGLQVKFTPAFEANMKRRQPPPAAAGQKAQLQINNNRTNRLVAAAPNNINRQVTSPQKPQQLPKPNTPLLSQALQNRRPAPASDANKMNNHPIRPKPVGDGNKPGGSSVIDLTDEDDRRDKSKATPSKLIPSKNITTVPLRTTQMRVNTTAQGIRLATSQGKVTPVSSVVTSSPQVMYVVQPSGQNVLSSTIGGPKALVVNFQSNGVLTQTLNGSAVSVIPKQGNTIQLKTVAPSKTLPNNKQLVKLPNKHPAPLPIPPVIRINTDKPLKPVPPRPHLTIRKTDTGIILQWKMPYELENYEVIASYQLYAYQETSALPSTDMWRKVGDVKALALPMACTLTQFADKNKYYFAVRPVDIHKRIGMFSEPEEISL